MESGDEGNVVEKLLGIIIRGKSKNYCGGNNKKNGSKNSGVKK